jgi:magnesium transporter
VDVATSRGEEYRDPTDASEELATELTLVGPAEAAERLREMSPEAAASALERMNPALAADIIEDLDEEYRDRLYARGPEALTQQWSINQTFEDDTVGRLMEPPVAVFAPGDTVGEVREQVREMVRRVFVTYCFVVDPQDRLLGLVTMRDLLVNEDEVRLNDIMLRDVFTLTPEMPLADAMKAVVRRHYPVYPVCNSAGRLIGLVRGQTMFEEQAYEISAQPGRMVGVDKEERLRTPWLRSLVFRHPWLQLNLFTAFLAAAVVGIFQETLDQIVILALFLPVLAGQSGNTGCQALAVTLRGLTLGEFADGSTRRLVSKEALLGFLNGALVGITAGLGMYIVARAQSNPDALVLGMIVAVAMVGACVVSGISGAIIPLTLRRVGADPATASSIFLTTATDVVSMGMLLGLATLLLR